MDARGFGLLMSSVGAGAMRRGGRPHAVPARCARRSRHWRAAAATLCAGLIALRARRQLRGALAVLAVLGACQIFFTTGCNTTLQLSTPDALRGRVMGLYALAFAGMSPFGALLIGTVAEHWGVRMACAVSGGGGLVVIGTLALVRRASCARGRLTRGA